MKKILTHLTGIVFLITILMAGGCSPAEATGHSIADLDQPVIYSGKVTIFLKFEEIDDKKQLVLYTEDNTEGVVAAEHTVYIERGTRVVWRRAKDSGIRKLGRIGPKTSEHKIFSEDAKTILLHKRYRVNARENIVLPEDQDYLEEPYDINFVIKETGEPDKADPYLRIEG